MQGSPWAEGVQGPPLAVGQWLSGTRERQQAGRSDGPKASWGHCLGGEAGRLPPRPAKAFVGNVGRFELLETPPRESLEPLPLPPGRPQCRCCLEA